uniref:Uncharacterized protein n=1 Tax=Arundo donax TaxID=35708 RepID=A0A0A9ET74_ARUDO
MSLCPRYGDGNSMLPLFPSEHCKISFPFQQQFVHAMR